MTTTAKKATSARIAATSPLLNAGSILSSTKRFSREKLYLAAVAELYKDAGAGTREERNERYRDAMAAAHDKYPDDETKLF